MTVSRGTHSPTVMLGVEAYSESSATKIPMRIGMTTRGTSGTLQAFSSATEYSLTNPPPSNLYETAVGQFRQNCPVGSVSYTSTLEGNLTSYTYLQRLQYAETTSGELFYIYGTVDGSGNYTPFTQEKGTQRYYYVQRLVGSTPHVANRFPLTELVPGQVTINSVSFSNNFQTATINSTTAGSGVTTAYFAKMSSSIDVPSFEDPTLGASGSAMTSPPSLASEGGIGWQTSNVFSVTPGETCHFYALGWTLNNPGPRGATVSPLFSVYAGDDRYGFQITNASGALALDIHDRVPRIVAINDYSYSITADSSFTASIPEVTADGSYRVLSEILNTQMNSNWKLAASIINGGVFFTITKRPQTGSFIEGTTITAVYPSPVKIRLYVFRS